MYLKGPKGKGEVELWVRVGNSTRHLEVADAVQYVAARRRARPHGAREARCFGR